MRKPDGWKEFQENYANNSNIVFYDPEYFEVIECGNISYLHYKGYSSKDIPQPINMSSGYRLFECYLGESLDLNDWDMSKVTNIAFMFSNAINLKHLAIDSWYTSELTNILAVFNNCCSLERLDLSNWDTHNMVDTSFAFDACENLQNLDLSGWDISNVQMMDAMFSRCRKLDIKEFLKWDISHIPHKHCVFKGCEETAAIDLIDKILKEHDVYIVSSVKGQGHFLGRLKGISLDAENGIVLDTDIDALDCSGNKIEFHKG